MAKYVKQEMNDLHGSDKKRAYYRLETIRKAALNLHFFSLL